MTEETFRSKPTVNEQAMSVYLFMHCVSAVEAGDAAAPAPHKFGQIWGQNLGKFGQNLNKLMKTD